MIERKDILSIPYLKKTSFTGSFQGMRFRFLLEKAGEEQHLEIAAWEEPYAYENTLDEKKIKMQTAFTEDGICEGIAWLNSLWAREPEKWKQASNNW